MDDFRFALVGHVFFTVGYVNVLGGSSLFILCRSALLRCKHAELSQAHPIRL